MVKNSGKWEKVFGKCFVCKDCGRAHLDKKEFVRHKLSHKMSGDKNTNKNKRAHKNRGEREIDIEVIEISSTTTEELDDDLQDEDFQIQNEESGSEQGDDEDEDEGGSGSGSEEDGETDQVESEPEPEEEEEEDYEVVILENEEEAEEEKLVEENWKCRLCHRHFVSSFHLERHTSMCQTQTQEMMLNANRSVDQEKTHVCPYCDKPFDDSSALLRHVKVHTGRDLEDFPCQTCSARFSEKNNRDRHELIHIRNALQPFPCSHCDKGFDNEDGWRVHERKHLGLKSYKCRYCPETFFTTTSARINHERTHIRNQLQPFHCSHCEKGFDNQEDCTAHERRHLGLNPHKCRSCSRFFGTTANRDRHEDTHIRNQAKPFHCSRCQKGFDDKDACQVHERRHLGLNPHPCRFCSRHFGTTNTRDKHEGTHIRNQVKPFHCPICKKGFNSHDDLKIHERKHFGLDPYPCKFCLRYFSLRGNRDGHERSCSWDEKSSKEKGEEEQAYYFCVYCSKSFPSQAARDIHLKDHTG